MAVLHIALLGSLTLTWGDTPLPPPSGVTARSLFAYLVTYRDRPHTRDLLAGTFWPDLPDAVARRRLSRALWQIRRSLQVEDPAQQMLLTDGDTVQLNPDFPFRLDVEEFARCSAQCAVAGPEHLEQCESCLALYQGEFLAGYYDDWVLVEREQFRDRFLVVLERLIEGYKRRGEYERALAHARRLASEAPWREEAHREVIRLYHLLGRDSEALKQFQACHQVLANELGAEPSPETISLAAEIAARSDLSVPPLAPLAARLIEAPLLERPEQLPLVGRKSELAELLRQVEAAAEGHGGLTIIYGEAGVGKTRLLQELERNARWRSLQIAWGRCYELAAPLAYQPLVEVLRAGLSVLHEADLQPLWRTELSRLLPELTLDEALPPPLSPEEERRRLLEAIAQGFLALGRAASHLVLLEDAHWMDPSSLEALRYLLPRLVGAPLLFVLTARPEEVSGQPAALLAALESTRLPHQLQLGRLDLAETEELIQRVLGLEQPASRFSARLHAETEGNPFFLIETLRALVDEDVLYRDENDGWSTAWDESTKDYAELPLPTGVVQTIERRLGRLPAPLEELVGLAAIIGRSISFDVWHQASEWAEDDLVGAGKELCAKGLLLCTHADASEADFVFAHDQIRRVAYDRLTPPHRRLDHRRVAQALVCLAPEKPGPLAYHWMEAGVWDKAVDAHRHAGDRAQAVYAHAEAADHYTQALEALEHLGDPPDMAQVFELRLAREAVYGVQSEHTAQEKDLAALETLAEALGNKEWQAKVALRQAEYVTKLGDYPAAIAFAQAAVQLSQEAGDLQRQAAGHIQWGDALKWQGDYEAARAQFEQALSLGRAVEAKTIEADSLRGLGNACDLLGDYAGSKGFQEQALNLYRELGDRWGEARTLNNLGRICRGQGDHIEAKAYYEQALSIERELGDLFGESAILFNFGIIFWDWGDYAGAKECYEKALAIAREISSRFVESGVLSNLARIHHYLGNDQVAWEYSQECQSIAREIGSFYLEAYGLTYQGHALVGLGQLAKATDVYREAITLRREMGQLNFAMESLAGLVRVHLAQGDVSQASILTEEILAHLERDGLTGMVEPFQVYLTCYHVLQANDDARAPDVLATAHTLLQEQAAKIPDKATRRMFLENVEAHREIVAAYRELEVHQGGQIQVRLPRANAPTGRPLHDDEYVTVTWTVDAPDDTEILRKTERRRQRIQRLLAEAQAQSAVPRDQDLADTLGVSLPTIRRDMAALHAEGHDLPTRGRK